MTSVVKKSAYLLLFFLLTGNDARYAPTSATFAQILSWWYLLILSTDTTPRLKIEQIHYAY